jgi:uncharacterized protein YunC (DUF1805 family)
MNATTSFNGKSSHNDHIMRGAVSKNVSESVGNVLGQVVAARRLADMISTRVIALPNHV